MENWKRFYFEGNQRWGWVESPEDWESFKQTYREAWHVLDVSALGNAKRHPTAEAQFGLYQEYTGDKTLKEFFDENGMTF